MLSYETLIEKNLGLVDRVIKDRIEDVNKIGYFTLDDLVQIGRVGLCKAARGYVPESGKAKFNTFAYICIRNEIYDALEYMSVRTKWESPEDFDVVLATTPIDDDFDNKSGAELVVNAIQRNSVGIISKGIEALKLYSQGFSYKDIGEIMGASTNNVTAWVSKARKYLLKRPEILALRESV